MRIYDSYIDQEYFCDLVRVFLDKVNEEVEICK